jgi:hypothetical protein
MSRYINGFGYRFNKASNKYKFDKINEISFNKIYTHLYKSIQSYTEQKYCTIDNNIYNIYEVNDTILGSMLWRYLYDYPVIINHDQDIDTYVIFMNDNLLKDNNITQDEYTLLRRVIYYSITQIKNLTNIHLNTTIINHFNKLEELQLILSIVNKLKDYIKDKNLARNFCYAVSKEIELKMKQQKEDVKVED